MDICNTWIIDPKVFRGKSYICGSTAKITVCSEGLAARIILFKNTHNNKKVGFYIFLCHYK